VSSSPCDWDDGADAWDSAANRTADIAARCVVVLDPREAVPATVGAMQASWSDASTIVTDDGVSVSCKTVWQLPINSSYDIETEVALCTALADGRAMESLALDATGVQPVDDRQPVCDVDVTALVHATLSSPRNTATGRRTRVPSLVKFLSPRPHRDVLVNGVVVARSSAEEAALYRVADAVVTLQGYVMTRNFLLRPLGGSFDNVAEHFTSGVATPIAYRPRVLVMNMAWSELWPHLSFDMLPRMSALAEFMQANEDVVMLYGGVNGYEEIFKVRFCVPSGPFPSAVLCL
jgi:hypothetical protein